MKNPYKNNGKYYANLEIRLIEGKGRGVFAKKDFRKNEVVEIAPIFLTEVDGCGNIENYWYGYNKKFNAVALGFGSLYNHCDEPNLAVLLLDKMTYQYRARRKIYVGEELTITYKTKKSEVWDFEKSS